MKIWSFACACLALATPMAGRAQSLVPVADVAPYDVAPYGVAVAPPLIDAPVIPLLPPPEIVASVRSAGFDPVSRPLHRGRVYIVFATDRDDIDVRLTIDAQSGRVLSVTRLAGELYEEPGYDRGYVPPRVPQGYAPPYERPPHLYERGPVPPAEVPGYGFDYSPTLPSPASWGGLGRGRAPPTPQGDIRLLPRERGRALIEPTRESLRRAPTASASRPPIRRSRPGDMVTGAVPQSVPQAPSVPSPVPAQVQATPSPAMTPIAPLQ
jgi:hypothetical protein